MSGEVRKQNRVSFSYAQLRRHIKTLSTKDCVYSRKQKKNIHLYQNVISSALTTLFFHCFFFVCLFVVVAAAYFSFPNIFFTDLPLHFKCIKLY